MPDYQLCVEIVKHVDVDVHSAVDEDEARAKVDERMGHLGVDNYQVLHCIERSSER